VLGFGDGLGLGDGEGLTGGLVPLGSTWYTKRGTTAQHNVTDVVQMDCIHSMKYAAEREVHRLGPAVGVHGSTGCSEADQCLRTVLIPCD
jgi:hypothetical protein